MKHEINIAATKSDGTIEVREVTGVSVFKQEGKNYVKFDVKDSKGLKHVFNFDVDSEPHIAPGTKVKIKFTTTVDPEFAEISKGAAQIPPPVSQNDFPKAVPQQQGPQKPKPGGKPGANSKDKEPFISFQTG